jgi:hypothetical protein
MIFVGYETGSMAYRIYDPASKSIHITRDVVFDEEAKWSWGCDKIDSEFIVEHVEGNEQEVVIVRQAGQEVNPILRVGAVASRSVTPGGEQSPVPGAGAASCSRIRGTIATLCFTRRGASLSRAYSGAWITSSRW